MTKDEADFLRACVWMIDLLDEDTKTALRISHGRPVALWIQGALEIISKAEEECSRAAKTEAELAAIKSLFEDIKTIPAPKFDKRKRKRK